MRAVDRDLFGDIVGGRTDQPGGAHEDHRLGRQVDVLLVLGRVVGDRLVAELGQLDANLFGRDVVGAVADDGPIAAAGRESLRGFGDGTASGERLLHGLRQLAQRSQQRLSLVADDTHAVGDGHRQQEAGRDL